MEKLGELFDSILFFVVAYPVTMFNGLVRPDRLYGPKKSSLTCPAGATLAISVSLFWWATLAYLKIENASNVNVRLPEQPQLIFCVVIVVVILLSWLAILRWPFRLGTSADSVFQELEGISYPMSIGLATSVVVSILSLLFPHGVVALATLSDMPEIWNKHNTPFWVRFLESQKVLETCSVLLLWGVAFFRALRTKYHASSKRCLGATITALAVGILCFLFLYKVTAGLQENLKWLEQSAAPPATVLQD